MPEQDLKEILSWMRGTDLVEVSWRRGTEGVEFKLEGAAPAAAPAFPATALIPVSSPGVGIFRWSEPGRARTAVEGRAVAEGDGLGVLETGGAPVPVTAPSAGRLVKVLIDEGKPVEFGQPLFLLAP